ncbi:MAG: hypothetical protein WKG07_00645 [Hymenobacter sp.]
MVNTTVNPTGTLPISVFAVNNDTWRETTITDANQPGRNDYVNTLLSYLHRHQQQAVVGGHHQLCAQPAQGR